MRILITLLTLLASTSFAELLPPEYFSQLPKFQKVALSPDGTHVAFLQNVENSSVVGVLNIGSRQVRHLVKSDNIGVRVRWFDWANTTELLISLQHATKRGGTKNSETRLYAMAVDGSDKAPRSLFRKNRSQRNERYSQFQDKLVDMLPDDPDHVLIALDTEYFAQPTVFKLNLDSARRESIEGGKHKIRDWITDQQHNVRVGNAFDYETGIARIFVRTTPNSKLIERFRYQSIEEPSISALGFGLDPNLLYYLADHEGTQALFTLDLTTDQKQLIFSHPQYDVEGSLVYSPATGDVVGVRHRSESTGIFWWNDERKQLEERLEATFPDQYANITSFSDDESRFILHVEGDSAPGIYYLVDKAAFRFSRLFQQYPQLKDQVPLDHELVSYKARDGLTIEGYLTRPAGAQGPTPLILHPHGGPGSRDTAGFDYWTSYFVSRGYTVFRPNFRGSSGFGYEFESAQNKSWGQAMQDDLEDAFTWLVGEKIVKPDSACIVGASYGGYAALMAAAKSSDMFQCAISFAGVSDLNMLVNKQRNFLNYESVKQQIGTKSSDLKNRSPVNLAADFSIPVLMLHGEADRVVSVDHTKSMTKALRKQRKPHRTVYLPDGNHYLHIQQNRHKLFAEMDRFLGKHL